MSLVVQPEDRPPVPVLGAVPEVHPAAFDAVVPLDAGIDRPAHPERVEDERADVHLTVVAPWRAAADPEVERRRIVPRAPEDGDRLVSARDEVEVRIRGGAGRGGRAPEQGEGGETPPFEVATRGVRAEAVGPGRPVGPGEGGGQPVECGFEPVRLLPRVGVVEAEPGRARDLGEVVPGPGKALDPLEGEARAEDGPQGVEQDHVEGRAVGPVAGALGIGAVGSVGGAHRDREVDDRAVDDPRREVGLGSPQGERARDHPRVADLVPVVVVGDPAVAPGERGFDAEPEDRLAGRPQRVRGQAVVQPVVTEGDREGHLGGVEEVRRVPIGKRADREKFGLGAGGEERIVGEPARRGEGRDAQQRFARNREQAATGHDMRHRFGREEPAGALEHARSERRGARIDIRRGEATEEARIREEARVRRRGGIDKPADLVERRRGGVDGGGEPEEGRDDETRAGRGGKRGGHEDGRKTAP